MGIIKNAEPAPEGGVVASALSEFEKAYAASRSEGEVHEGLVVTGVDGDMGVFLQVGPDSYFTCGALIQHSLVGKHVRVTVEVLEDGDPHGA